MHFQAPLLIKRLLYKKKIVKIILNVEISHRIPIRDPIAVCFFIYFNGKAK